MIYSRNTKHKRKSSTLKNNKGKVVVPLTNKKVLGTDPQGWSWYNKGGSLLQDNYYGARLDISATKNVPSPKGMGRIWASSTRVLGETGA